MRPPAFVLLAMCVALAACSHETHPGAVVWGSLTAVAYETPPPSDGYALGPRGGGAPDLAIEEQLTHSLDWRGIAVGADQPLRLLYMMDMVPIDAEAEGLGVLLGGSVGSSGTGNDVGLGIDLPLLLGDREVRQTSFVLELSVEDTDGTIYWRGWAEGRARSMLKGDVLRPVVPALIDWIGSDVREKRFVR